MAVKASFEPQDFLDDVAIDAIDLDHDFRRQASLFAHYASKHFQSQQQVGNKKILLDVTEAKLDKEIRNKLRLAVDEDGKQVKFTEKMVENEIKRTVAYIQAASDYHEAVALVDLSKNALEAFKQRKDMLVSLGATQREEMKGELRMGIGNQRKELMAETARRMGHGEPT